MYVRTKNNIKDQVADIYFQELGRPPDPEGLAFYSTYVAGDGTFEDVRNSLQQSPEYATYQDTGMAYNHVTKSHDVMPTTTFNEFKDQYQAGSYGADYGELAFGNYGQPVGGASNIFETSSNNYQDGSNAIAGSIPANAFEVGGAGLIADAGRINNITAGGANVLGNAGMNAMTGQGGDILAQADPYNEFVQGGAAGLGGAMDAPGVENAMEQLSQNSPYIGEAADIYRGSIGDAAVQRTMNQYLNPYQNQVIDNMVTRSREQRDEQLNSVRGQAAQSGAYGGARQGLVESEVYDNQAQTENEAVSNLLFQGFNQAAAFGQQQQGVEQGVATGMAGLGSQELARQQSLGQLGLGYQNNQIQASNLLGQLGLGAAAQDISRGGALAQVGLGQSGQDITRGTALGNLGLGQGGLQLNSGSALANLGNSIGNRGVVGGNSLINAAATGQGMGFDAMNQQLAMGSLLQNQEQALLDQASGQYDAYANYPLASLATALAGLSGNPLANAGTTTGTTTSNPGAMNWASLAAGLAKAGK